MWRTTRPLVLFYYISYQQLSFVPFNQTFATYIPHIIPHNVTTDNFFNVTGRKSAHRYLFCSLYIFAYYISISILIMIGIKKRLQLDIYLIFIRNQAEPLHMIDIKRHVGWRVTIPSSVSCPTQTLINLNQLCKLDWAPASGLQLLNPVDPILRLNCGISASHTVDYQPSGRGRGVGEEIS